MDELNFEDLGLTESGYYWCNDGKAWSMVWWDEDYPDVVVCVGMNEPVMIHDEDGEAVFEEFVWVDPPAHGPESVEGGCEEDD